MFSPRSSTRHQTRRRSWVGRRRSKRRGSNIIYGDSNSKAWKSPDASGLRPQLQLKFRTMALCSIQCRYLVPSQRASWAPTDCRSSYVVGEGEVPWLFGCHHHRRLQPPCRFLRTSIMMNRSPPRIMCERWYRRTWTHSEAFRDTDLLLAPVARP